MTETINDRIEMLINEHCNGSKAAFARSIGFGPTGLSSYLGKKRRSSPSIDICLKIIDKYKVDPLWLLTGEESKSKVIHTEGDYSPASQGGDISVVVGDSSLSDKVKLLEDLVQAKDEHIKDLRAQIEELRLCKKRVKNV